jgi:hypothetical protein
MNFSVWLTEFVKSGSNEINGNLLLSVIDPNGKFTQLIKVKCKCGAIRTVSLYAFISQNKQVTCGRCHLSKIKESGQTTFNNLTILSNLEESRGSDRVKVKCSCGNVVDNVILRQVFAGNKKSCGSCSVNKVKKFGQTKFDKLLILTPLDSIKLISQKVDVICDCGNKVKVIYRNLVTGNSKSCGKCELFSLKQSGVVKWGRLSLIDDPSTLKSLSQQTSFLCNCGRVTRLKLYNVVSGHTTTCGKCYEQVRAAFDNRKEEFKEMQFPIPPGKLFGVIEFKNTIYSSNTKLDAKCPICNNKWAPAFKDIKRGYSLSCGCSLHITSGPQREIFEHIISTGFEAMCEARIGGLKYDIFIPSASLAIEYHGLKWHSTDSSRRSDLNKYKTAIASEIDLMVVYEDEWENKRKQICDIINNRLNVAKTKFRIRPSRCRILHISSNAADTFYDQNHYIGKTCSNMNICAEFDGKIIACMSFKHPNRQSKYTFELTRMASDLDFRVHGIWSKLFKKFVNETSPESIVSFSDNRLFTGKVYEKLGFKFDGNVKPDYYWAKGRRRFNKSGLRKPLGTIETEQDLRTSQGFFKIWDLGKKRWVWKTPEK